MSKSLSKYYFLSNPCKSIRPFVFAYNIYVWKTLKQNTLLTFFQFFLVNLTPSSWATHVAWTPHRFFRKLRPIDNIYCSAVLFTSSGCKVRKNAPYVPKCDVGWCLFFQLQNGDKSLMKSQIVYRIQEFKYDFKMTLAPLMYSWDFFTWVYSWLVH